jgi:PKD repeat protein
MARLRIPPRPTGTGLPAEDSVSVGLAIGLGMLVALLVAQAPASACGIGFDTPTMLANQTPALLFPATTTPPADAPTGIFLSSYLAGQSITFDEDISRMVSLRSKDGLRWRWSFGDASPFAFSATPSHTFAHPGDYTVRVATMGSTDTAWLDFDSAQVRILAATPAHPPVAAFDAPGPVAIGETVTFDAGHSHAADGSALTYSWNFDDGGSAQAARVSHQFVSPGSGLVALTVTDAHGESSVVTHPITIVPALPVAALTQRSWLAMQGADTAFDASASTPPDDPPGDTIAHYVWRFDDGSPAQATTGPLVTHRFRTAGDHTVTVSAVDDAAGAAGVASLRVRVLPSGAPLLAGLALALAVVVGLGVSLLRSPSRREWMRRLWRSARHRAAERASA